MVLKFCAQTPVLAHRQDMQHKRTVMVQPGFSGYEQVTVICSRYQQVKVVTLGLSWLQWVLSGQMVTYLKSRLLLLSC